MTLIKKCLRCKKQFRFSPSRNRKYCSQKCYWKDKKRRGLIPPLRKGSKHTERTKRKMSKSAKGRIPWNTDKKLSESHKKKISRSLRKRTLEGKHRRDYKGLTPLYKEIYKSFKYGQWRSDIFTRDDFTCVLCGKQGGWIEAHHYPKSFSEIFYRNKIKTLKQALECEEFWNINNGRTLCKKCHKLTSTYGRKYK